MRYDLTCFNWIGIIKKTDLPSNAKFVALYLATFMNSENDIAFPSISRIVKETGLSKSTVIRQLNYLQEQHFLKKYAGGKNIYTIGGMQLSNVYQIAFPQPILETIAKDILDQGSITVTLPESGGGVTEDQRGCHGDITPNNNISNNSSTSENKFSDDDFKTSQYLMTLITGVYPKFTKPNLSKWSDQIRLMRERDNRTHQEIRELFEWANNDPFWQANILSPQKLRQQWDRLTMQKNKSQPKEEVWWKGGI